MTPEELDAIEARLNAATSWPWWRKADATAVWGGNGASGYEHVATVHSVRAEADAGFLVHAPSDVARLVAEVRRLQALVSPFALAGVEPTDGSAIRELRAEVARLTREIAEEREEAATLRAILTRGERDEADAALTDAELLRLTRELGSDASHIVVVPNEVPAADVERSLGSLIPLELLQFETPMEQANVEPARPVRVPQRAGWEIIEGTGWGTLRVDGRRRARVYSITDTEFGWDTGPGSEERTGYPTLQDAQRAAEGWLATNGGGA